VDCPLKKKPGAIWVHVVDHEAGNVVGMAVTCDGTPGTTDTHGVAFFDPLPEKPDYKVELGALGALADTYSLPESKPQTVGVKDGSVTYVSFELPKLGKLTIEARAEDSNELILLDGINVEVTGASAKSGPSAKGLFHHEKAPTGDYQPALKLSPPASEQYALPKDKIGLVKLKPGETKVVPVLLRVRPAPVIEIEAPKIVIVKHDYHGLPKPGVPVHRIPVKVSAKGAFDGTGEFTFPSGVQVFDGDTEVMSGVKVDTADLASGKTFFLQADKPSAGDKLTELKFELKGGTIEPLPAVTEKITCVKLELEVYECLPKVITKTTKPEDIGPKVIDDVKVGTGQPVPLQSKTFEHRRVKMVVKQALPADFTGKLVVEPVNGSVELFTEQKAATGQTAVTPLTFENSTLGVDGKVLWVEGKTLSPVAGDTGFRVGVEGVLEKSTSKVAEGDRVVVTVFEVEVEMFRGTTVLTVAPYHASDFVAYLDVPLPDHEHNDEHSVRPPESAFPKKTEYDDNVHANRDKGVFRWRLKVKPVNAIAEPDTLDVNAKVLHSDGTPLDKVATKMTLDKTASHNSGYIVPFKKRASEWESPYSRIATWLADQSKGEQHCVIHSIPPYGSTNMDHGKMLGRKLRLEGNLAGWALKKDWIMGGKPYAVIPIEFLYVNDKSTTITPLKQTTARDKIFNLNQFWAAQGLEFKLQNPTPIIHRKSPPRTLISIGDFTGCAIVADHPFRIEITLSTGPTVLGVDCDANLDFERGSRQDCSGGLQLLIGYAHWGCVSRHAASHVSQPGSLPWAEDAYDPRDPRAGGRRSKRRRRNHEPARVPRWHSGAHRYERRYLRTLHHQPLP
jgi:hypothetical protein